MDVPGIVEVTNIRCNQKTIKSEYSRLDKVDLRDYHLKRCYSRDLSQSRSPDPVPMGLSLVTIAF